MQIKTYLDSNAEAVDLECAPRPRLVFRCRYDKGPGFSEELNFHYGRALGGNEIALWLSSDWTPPDSQLRYAVAWTVQNNLPAKPWTELLMAYWKAERDCNHWDEPNFSEIVRTPRSLMTPVEIWSIVEALWPEEET
jgi:hypothetical protein